ncbi:MAG: hypothetical protein RL375_4316 [Pseudomonadota bacterium]
MAAIELGIPVVSRLLRGLLWRIGIKIGGGRPWRRPLAAATAAARPARSAGLQALYAAALALPGLASQAVLAADEELVLQTGQYREAEREVAGQTLPTPALRADSLQGSLNLRLNDRTRLRLGVLQDTWSGATPISTAPRVFQGNRFLTTETTTMASPIILGTIYLNAARQPLLLDEFQTPTNEVDHQLVHTLSSASPETRRQADLALTYEFDRSALTVGGGSSGERDYTSRWAQVGLRVDDEHKLTTLNLGASYTSNHTQAVIDHDAAPYIDTSFQSARIQRGPLGQQTLKAGSSQWGVNANLVQVLDRHSQAEGGVSYSRSSGYLSNPYKVTQVVFIDPSQQFQAPPDGFFGNVEALLEQRPEQRRQWTASARYVRHFEASNGALHLGYRFYRDDWGVSAHTLDAAWAQPLDAGWLLTPRLRYYTQQAATFYTPYLVSDQAFRPAVVDPVRGQVYIDSSLPSGLDGPHYFDDPALTTPDGFNPITGQPLVDAEGRPVSQDIANTVVPATVKFDRQRLPSHFSSDARLAGFGTLGVGLTLSKRLQRGLTLEAGVEVYRRAASLQWGASGDGAFADSHAWMFGLALRTDLSETSAPAPGHTSGADHGHGPHSPHSPRGPHVPAPAGVMFGHMLTEPGASMLGVRFMDVRQGGPVRQGRAVADDAQIVAGGCPGTECGLVPAGMRMRMHMLDIGYVPAPGLQLMLMPQFVDMSMSSRQLDGGPTDVHSAHTVHATGGLGDTTVAALFSLDTSPQRQLHLGLGLSIPTGDVDVRLRRNHGEDPGFIHYGMQLGSGTWDLLPSLTGTQRWRDWSLGWQASGVLRLARSNASGYALGHVLQGTAWAGFDLTPALSTTLRAAYTRQGAIKGEYNDVHPLSNPADHAANHGGRYWDAGLGLGYTPRTGTLRGSTLSLEWLQPVSDRVNGIQLDRQGTLHASWMIGF